MTRKHTRLTGWAYATPAVLLFSLFLAYPIVYNLVSGFSSGHGPLYNYQMLFERPAFASSIENSVRWVVCSGAFELVLGFILAVLIENYIARGRTLYRLVLFLPMVVTPTVIAMVFTTLLAPSFGAFYGMFRSVGVGSLFPALLSNPSTVSYTLIAINIWQWLGWFVLLFSVALSRINAEILDAAAVDGASGARLWWSVLVPLVRPTTLTLALFAIIEALQQFAVVYIATDGGPGNSSQVMGSYVYKLAFVDNFQHLSSALASILFAMTLVMVGAVFGLSRGRFAIST